MSLLGETGPEDTELQFVMLSFHKPIPGTNRVDFVFVVICNHELYIDYVRKMHSSFIEDKQMIQIGFESSEVVFDLPILPPKTVEGWKIQPLTYPTISQVDVLQFKIGRSVPGFRIELEWVGNGHQRPLVHRVAISGAKAPQNYCYMRYYPQTAVIRDQLVSTQSELDYSRGDLGVLLPTLPQLLESLKHLDDWFVFGVGLGVSVSQLWEIESSHPKNIKQCKIEMLQYWLNSVIDPSWKDVVQALELIDELRLAAQVKQNYMWLTTEDKGEVIRDQLVSTQSELDYPRGDLGVLLPTLQQLLECLKHLDNWFVFGVGLGVPISKLQMIELSHLKDIKRCKVEMLQYWLDSDIDASWKKVVQALELIDELRLAAQVKQNYMWLTTENKGEDPV